MVTSKLPRRQGKTCPTFNGPCVSKYVSQACLILSSPASTNDDQNCVCVLLRQVIFHYLNRHITPFLLIEIAFNTLSLISIFTGWAVGKTPPYSSFAASL